MTLATNYFLATQSFWAHKNYTYTEANERDLGSISPNFIRQAKLGQRTAFSKKIAVQFQQHSVNSNQPKTVLKFAKMCAPFATFGFWTPCSKNASYLVCANKCWWNGPFERDRRVIDSLQDDLHILCVKKDVFLTSSSP